jgi:aryl-alcohol dehydrogenase-like predicted oxidoreductase
MTIVVTFQKNWPRINNFLDTLREIGAKYNATPVQVTLAWIINQSNDIIPIPGSKQIKYVDKNLGALNIKLSEEDLRAVRKLPRR